jgi:hypothetical protein
MQNLDAGRDLRELGDEAFLTIDDGDNRRIVDDEDFALAAQQVRHLLRGDFAAFVVVRGDVGDLADVFGNGDVDRDQRNMCARDQPAFGFGGRRIDRNDGHQVDFLANEILHLRRLRRKIAVRIPEIKDDLVAALLLHALFNVLVELEAAAPRGGANLIRVRGRCGVERSRKREDAHGDRRAELDVESHCRRLSVLSSRRRRMALEAQTKRLCNRLHTDVNRDVDDRARRRSWDAKGTVVT